MTNNYPALKPPKGLTESVKENYREGKNHLNQQQRNTRVQNQRFQIVLLSLIVEKVFRQAPL